MEIMDEAAEMLIKYQTKEKNILKVVEECAELQELMVKYLTKNENLKPSIERITEEMGDVLFRIYVASVMLGIEEDMINRAELKAESTIELFKNKFENGKRN